MQRDNDDELIGEFVAAFEILDDLILVGGDDAALPAELDAGRDDSQWARQKWKPARITTRRVDLDRFLSKYDVSLPELYENLLLSYRWLEVDLRGFARLFENRPGPISTGLFAAIAASPLHEDVLLPLGLVPFARAPDSYDVVCFDTTNGRARRDFPVVQIDHEVLFSRKEVSERRQLWQSFRLFVEDVVTTAGDIRCRQ